MNNMIVLKVSIFYCTNIQVTHSDRQFNAGNDYPMTNDITVNDTYPNHNFLCFEDCHFLNDPWLAPVMCFLRKTYIGKRDFHVTFGSFNCILNIYIV